MPLVEKGLLSLPGHLISSQIFSGVLVALFSVFCVIVCRSMYVLLFSLPLHYLSFDLRILITTLVSLIYGFWLPLWYLQTFQPFKTVTFLLLKLSALILHTQKTKNKNKKNSNRQIHVYYFHTLVYMNDKGALLFTITIRLLQ